MAPLQSLGWGYSGGGVHAGLEIYTHDTPEFITDSQHTSTASQDIWFDEVPEYLIFQLQRVVYDQQTHTAKKDNSKFDIDMYLSMER
jgi:hypothetical protein